MNGEFILGLIWGQPCYQWLKENYPSSPGAGGANLATASSGTRISFLIAVFFCHYFGCEVLGYHNINCADYAYPIKKTLPEEILCSQAWWYIVPDSPRAGIFWTWCIFPGDLEWCLCEVCSARGMSWRTHHSSWNSNFSSKGTKWGFFSFFPKNAVRYLEPCNIPIWDQQLSRGVKLFTHREAASVDCFPAWMEGTSLWMKGTSRWERSSIQRYLRSCSGFCFFIPHKKLNITWETQWWAEFLGPHKEQ